MSAAPTPLPGWIAQAACRNEGDPEIFFPAGDRDSMTPLALSICSSCPVKSECLNFALSKGTEGIWGGLTSEQRRMLRHRRRWEVAS